MKIYFFTLIIIDVVALTSCKLKINIIIIQIRRFFNFDPCYLNLKAMKFQPNMHIF